MGSSGRSGLEQRPVVIRRSILVPAVLIIVFFSAFVFLSAEAEAKSGSGSGDGGGGGKSATPSDSGNRGAEGDGKSAPPSGSEKGGGSANERSPSGGRNVLEEVTDIGKPPSGTPNELMNNTSDTRSLNAPQQVPQRAAQTTGSGLQEEAAITAAQLAQKPLDSVKHITGDALLSSVNNPQRAADKVVDPLAPIDDKLVPVNETALVTGTVTDALAPITGKVADKLAPATNTVDGTVLDPSESASGETVADSLAPATRGTGSDSLDLAAEPVLEAATLQITDTIATPTLDPTWKPVSPAVIAPTARQVVLFEIPILSTYSPAPRPTPATSANTNFSASHEAGYSGLGAEIRAAESSELLGSFPALYDDSLLSGRHDAALLAFGAEANGIQDQTQNPPLSTSELPSGLLTLENFFSGSVSAGAGVGPHLLAVLALLSILARSGGLSWCHRDAYKLVSSPRLVAELPG